MKYRAYANNALGTNQLDEVVGGGTLAIALGIILLAIALAINMTLLQCRKRSFGHAP